MASTRRSIPDSPATSAIAASCSGSTAGAADRPRGAWLAYIGVLVLLAAPLTGCIGTMGTGYDSPQEAQDAAHLIVKAEDEPSIALGLIDPETTEDVPQGKQEVTFALWNEDTGEALTDAEVTLDAFMPMMSHGTEPETDPEHEAHGVYRGSTNFMMGDDWQLFVNATLSSDTTAHFVIDLHVSGDGGDGGGDGHGDMDHDSGYASYDEAKGDEGEVFAPDEAANTTWRLKLLEPNATSGLPTGQTNVTFLLFDEEADEPVENGTASLEGFMTDMGHGTSPESDPMHLEHGVWRGDTNLNMEGNWELRIDHTDEDGEQLSWTIDVTVGNETDDGAAFEPYNVTFREDVSSLDYNESHAFDVEGANATITMNASLEGATPVADELTVDLLDPEGNELGSVTLNAEATDSQLVVEDVPEAGEYAVQVHGQAADASYEIVLHITPP